MHYDIELYSQTSCLESISLSFTNPCENYVKYTMYNVQSTYIWLANYAHVLQWQYRAQNLKLACISFIRLMEHVLHVKFILLTLFFN